MNATIKRKIQVFQRAARKAERHDHVELCNLALEGNAEAEKIVLTLLPPPGRRGFAVLDPDVLHAIASKGGRAAHEVGTAHEFTSEEAKHAGRLGGLASHRNRNAGRASTSESTEK